MFEFHIVSLDNSQWLFEAASSEERDEWVAAIEQQILNVLQVNFDEVLQNQFCVLILTMLQGNESNKAAKGQSYSTLNLQVLKTIKNDVPGNTTCVDCDTPSKI